MPNVKWRLFLAILICIFLFSVLYSESYAEVKKLSAKERRQARLLERQKEKTIKALYKEGSSYYRRLELDKAKQTFEQILALDPAQKKAKLYIEKKIPSKRRLEAKKKAREEKRARRLAPKIAKRQAHRLKKEKREKIKTLYKEAMAYYRKDEITKADETLKQILDMDAGQKKARIWLTKKIPPARKREAKRLVGEEAKAKKKMPSRPEDEALRQKAEKASRIKVLYKKAISYYRQDEITKAEQTFKQILDIDPGQKKAKIYLAKKIPSARKREVKKRASEARRLKEKAERKAKEEARISIRTAPLADTTKVILDESVREFVAEKRLVPELVREKHIEIGLNLYSVYDDNIYGQKDSPEQDVITHISPEIFASYGNLNHLFTGFYNADGILYAENTRENRFDQSFGASASLFRQSPIKIDVSDTIGLTSEPSTSEVTEYIRRLHNTFNSGIRWDISPKTSVAFKYDQFAQNYISRDYDDFSYVQQSFNPSLYWHLSPKTSIFASYAFGLTSYYAGKATYDSWSNQITGGIEGDLTPKSKIYANAGYQYRDYYETTKKRGPIDVFILEGIYELALTPKTSLEFIASSNIYESVYGNVGYYKSVSLYGNCKYRLLKNLDLTFGTFYSRNNYPFETQVIHQEGVKRRDNLYGLHGQLSYNFRDWLSAYAHYEYRYRESNAREFEYQNNRISGGLKLSF